LKKEKEKELQSTQKGIEEYKRKLYVVKDKER